MLYFPLLNKKHFVIFFKAQIKLIKFSVPISLTIFFIPKVGYRLLISQNSQKLSKCIFSFSFYYIVKRDITCYITIEVSCSFHIHMPSICLLTNWIFFFCPIFANIENPFSKVCHKFTRQEICIKWHEKNTKLTWENFSLKYAVYTYLVTMSIWSMTCWICNGLSID